MTVAARREAVQRLVARGLSQRRACVLLPLQRSTFGYQARPERNTELATQVAELARRAAIPMQASHPGHVWTDDCLHDRGLNGTPLKVLTVRDECTREGLAIEAATSWPAARVLAVLERRVTMHGTPQFIRRDHGPECMALAIRGWLAQHRTRTLSIDPGCPWQNGYGESFKGTVRDECLNMHAFHAVAEARVTLAAYRRQDNEERPHSCVRSQTPAECKRDGLER